MPTIEHQGKLIHELDVANERRADFVAPNHANGLQLSADRCLLLVSTLGFRGVDDARSIVYQLRRDRFDGPIIRQGLLAASVDDWDPQRDGSRYVRQHGHPAGFGVPRGALIGGRRVPHENVFAVMFRQCPRVFDSTRSYLLWQRHPHDLAARLQCVLIVQFRLNDAGDDIEILAPATPLRQIGYETGPQLCAQPLGHMNQSLSNPVPLNDDASQWVVVNHFGKSIHSDETGGLATLRFAFNAKTGLYEWAQTGPAFGQNFFEASIARRRDGFVIAARPAGSGHIGWARVDDPLRDAPTLTQPTDIFNRAPLTAYTAADGMLRLLSGDQRLSPHGSGRDPLYLWDIDPDRGFSAVARQTVIDTAAANMPIARKHGPKVDFGRLMPHVGGDRQVITHRLSPCGFKLPDVDLGGPPHPLPDEEFHAAGVYHAHLCYDEPLPGPWSFA